MTIKNISKNKVGYFSKIDAWRAISFISIFAIFAIMVLAAAPSDPTGINPSNNSATTLTNITLECTGAVDPEGDPLTILFFQNKSSGSNESYTSDDGWSTSTGPLYSGTRINTTQCDPCYVENITTGAGDNKEFLSIYTATGAGEVGVMIEQYSISGDTFIIQNNLSSNISYWFLFHGPDNVTDRTAVYKDDASSTCKNETYTTKVCGENNEPLLNMDCTACSGRVQSVAEIWMNINGTYYEVLQNTTADNFNWTGLTEKSHEWGCQICDNNSECTGDFISNFNVTFSRLNVTFYDEPTLSSLSGINITFQSISDNYAINDTTINGSLMPSLPIGNYTLRFWSDDHYERLYDIQITSTGVTHLNLYMLNKTEENVLNVTASVITNLNDDLEDAIIVATRYNIDTNTYVTTERVRTNFDGDGSIYVTTDEFYKFIVEYPIGVSVLSTSKTYVVDDEITFVVDLTDDPTDIFYNTQDIQFNLSYTNSTKLFEYTFNDPLNLLTKTCLNIYTKSIVEGDVHINNSCVTTHAGTINLYVAGANSTTYMGEAIAVINGSEYVLGNVLYAYPDQPSPLGNMGLVIIILLTIGMAMIGIWSPVVALIMAPIPLVFGSVTGIIAVQPAITIALYLAVLIIAGFIGRER